MTPLSIMGIGSALPDRIVTNEELEATTGFAAARIRELFDVERRHWSRGLDRPDPPTGQRCSDLAAKACLAALSDAQVQARDVAALIAVTTTPDSLNPPLDALVAKQIGLAGIPAFSLQAPCTGLFRAIELATALASRMQDRPILIVTAETPSPFFRFGPGLPSEQVMNSLLYADGAGAVVCSTAPSGGHAIERLHLDLNSDLAEPGITFPGMLSAMPPTPERFAAADYLGRHDFRRVLRRGSKLAAGAAQHLMGEMKVGVGDVRFFVTHQATGSIRRIAASYGFPAEKIPTNIERIGNTISASILILLDELAKTGQPVPGDLLILHTAESSTWSSAAMAVRW